MAIEALHGNHYLFFIAIHQKSGKAECYITNWRTLLYMREATYIIVSIFERMEVFKLAAIGKYE